MIADTDGLPNQKKIGGDIMTIYETLNILIMILMLVVDIIALLKDKKSE